MNTPSRIVTPERRSDDVGDTALRPQLLSEFVGQAQARKNLSIFIEAARKRNEALDHVLFVGPPGLGKTTLAQIVARELGVGFRATSGPVIAKAGDLAALLTNLEERDVLFIDEIHRLSPAVEEVLYPAMEDFQLDLIIGEGPAARSVKIELAKFTLVGATTRAGLLTNPLRDRFGIPVRLNFYTEEELEKIVTRGARVLNIGMTPDGANEIARRARGTPRIAGRLLRRVRDFASAADASSIDRAIADHALSALEVDAAGLDAMDRRYLTTIAMNYGGGPVGVETMAAALSEPRDAIEDIIEPFLIQCGYLQRTPRGRLLTSHAFRHLGLAEPAPRSGAVRAVRQRRQRRRLRRHFVAYSVVDLACDDAGAERLLRKRLYRQPHRDRSHRAFGCFDSDTIACAWSWNSAASISNRAELGEYRHKDHMARHRSVGISSIAGEEILGIIEFVGHNDPIFSAAKDWLQSVQYLPRSSCGVERGSWDMEMAADKLLASLSSPVINDVRVEVAAVAPKLAGEGINLLIHPEIGLQGVRVAGLLALGLVRLAAFSEYPVDLGRRPLQAPPENDAADLTADPAIRRSSAWSLATATIDRFEPGRRNHALTADDNCRPPSSAGLYRRGVPNHRARPKTLPCSPSSRRRRNSPRPTIPTVSSMRCRSPNSRLDALVGDNRW